MVVYVPHLKKSVISFLSYPFAYNALVAANVSGSMSILLMVVLEQVRRWARANLGIANVDDTRDGCSSISMTQVGLDNKIDKVPKVPEIIVTSSTNTLALKGLEVSSSAQNQVVTIDPLTGVLNRSSFLSTKNVVDYRATEGQLCLQRPVPLPHLTKLMYTVIRINASVVGSSTIKLEKRQVVI
jgi:hypothetical protein